MEDEVMNEQEKIEIANRLRATLSKEELEDVIDGHILEIKAAFHLRSPMRAFSDVSKRLAILKDLIMRLKQ